MQLSIVMPTYRSDLLACSRIMQACSWAGPEIEVIVRDNSGNAYKRSLLAQIKHEHCNIIVAEPCGPVENYTDALRHAKGDYLYVIADDDLGFDRAMISLPGVVSSIAGDRSVVGISGNYAIEHTSGSAVVGYQDLDSDDVVARVSGYLANQGVNVLIYSPVRSDVFRQVFEFIRTLPFYFSFHDQISCLLYLLNGKFARLKRLMYLYDVGQWAAAETAQKIDLEYYTRSKLDPAINKLHWFLCGFEGAVLIRNADMFPDYPLLQRQAMADRWFSTMFVRFKNNDRDAFESRFTSEADLLCGKWKTSAGKLSFHDMLNDIGEFMALWSASDAKKYRDYWNAMLANGATVGRATRVAKAG